MFLVEEVNVGGWKCFESHSRELFISLGVETNFS